jgi:pantetheine-phosphate adenylyltransferase
MQEVFKDDDNVEVICDSGLIAEAVKKIDADAIIKGIRSETDLRSEQVMAEANATLGKGLETLFLTSKGELQGVSSSLVRQIYQLGGDVSPFVPEIVHQWLKNK